MVRLRKYTRVGELRNMEANVVWPTLLRPWLRTYCESWVPPWDEARSAARDAQAISTSENALLQPLGRV